MGYIHDTAMSQFIPPNQIEFSAGTWALAVASNVWSMDRTAADASFTVYVPVLVPSNSVALKGVKLESVELMWATSVEVMDDVATVALYTDTLQASAASGSGTINTAAAITQTQDTGHDTDADRLAIDEHRMKVTITTPVWLDNDVAVHLEVVFNAGTNGVVKVFGAIANYTVRL